MKYFFTSIGLAILIISILIFRNLFNQEYDNYISTDENLTETLVFQAEPSFQYTSPKLSKKTIELIFKNIGNKHNKSPITGTHENTNKAGPFFFKISVNFG